MPDSTKYTIGTWFIVLLLLFWIYLKESVQCRFPLNDGLFYFVEIWTVILIVFPVNPQESW